MKTWVKMLLTGIAAFAAGFGAGYLAKKRTEVSIEEITEDELNELMKESLEQEGKTKEAENDIPEVATSNVSQDEKEIYFRRWKETPADIYDTRSESPEEVETVDTEGIEDYLDKIDGIEPGTMADWMMVVDENGEYGEYDPIELIWYEKDNIITDEDGDQLDESDKYMGFDIKDEWVLADQDTTGDPNVRIIFNHKTKTVYHITRVSKISYSRLRRKEEFEDDDYRDEEEDE